MRFIPDSMQRLPCWVLWRLEQRQGRATKVPYRADGSGCKASSTDAQSWCSFHEAEAALNRERAGYTGLGFVIQEGRGLVFIDLDHCISADGELSDFAAGVLEWFPDTYVERSQSGEGLHIFCYGTVPRSFRDSKLGLEVYAGKRYAAITGDAMQACELTACQAGLDWLWSNYAPEEQTDVAGKHSCSKPLCPGSGRSGGLSDSDIVSRLQRHGKGVLLWAGDWAGAGYSSRSEADAALCTILAFWCDRETEQMERLFSASGLAREKWNGRRDYRDRTIAAGCAACGESLGEYTARMRRKEAEELDRLLAIT